MVSTGGTSLAPFNRAAKAWAGPGVGVGGGVCVAVGDGVGGPANTPDRIVASPLLIERVSPATTVGTVPPCPVERKRPPWWNISKVIVPIFVEFKNTSNDVWDGRFTFTTCTVKVLDDEYSKYVLNPRGVMLPIGSPVRFADRPEKTSVSARVTVDENCSRIGNAIPSAAAANVTNSKRGAPLFLPKKVLN